MGADLIYNFEQIVPDGVKPLFTVAGFQAFTITDPPAYQRIRPRLEIRYRNIGEEKPRRVVRIPDGTKRGCAFLGELKIYAISDADEPGKLIHSSYRVQVRTFCAGLDNLINEVALPFHKLQWIECGNEETGIRQNDNFYQTTFPFQVKLSIQQNAWEQLTT